MKTLVLPLLACLFLASCSSRRNQVKAEVFAIATALEAYHAEYGAYPPASNHAVASAIQGGNPKHLIFMEVSPRMLNSAGELVDPWGTPYRFTCLPGQAVIIHSAGSDKVFDDGDDFSLQRKSR